MSKIVHVPIEKYIGIQEKDGSYSIWNPQTLEGYSSSLEEIKKFGIQIFEHEPLLPLYDKYGNKIDYPDLDFPNVDRNGKKIVYIDDDDRERLLPLLPKMTKTQEWINNVMEFHYSRKYLPSWVKEDEFYSTLQRDLFFSTIGNLVDGDKNMDFRDSYFQLYSGDVDLGAAGGLGGKVKSDYIKIPDCVVKEFIQNKLIDENIFKKKSLKDNDSIEMRYSNDEEEEEDEEEDEEDDMEKKKVSPTEISENILSSPLIKQKRDITHDSISNDFENIISSIHKEIKNEKDSQSRNLFRKIGRAIRRLKNDTFRLAKFRPKINHKNVTSGFMKPVKVSIEMSQFCGWKPEELHSRMEVTKKLVDYIKNNNLQNQNDRRQIIPDEKLGGLFGYNPTVDKPLTYPELQRKIQPHMIKT